MNSPDQNPYAPPQAAVAESGDDEVGVVSPFAPSRRLGRVRYLAYSMGGLMVAGLFSALGAGISAAGGQPMFGGLLTTGATIAYMVFGLLLAIQRSHDFDQSGWLALLSFVPVANLVFLFIPGSRGRNRFGPKPPPNGKGLILLALAPVFVALIGIVAAVAIPQYQQYAERARAAQSEGGL